MSAPATAATPLLQHNMSAPAAASDQPNGAGATPVPDGVAQLQVLTVHDGTGNPVLLTSIWSQKTTIVVFLRHWLCEAVSV